MKPPDSLETPVDPHDAPPPAAVYKPTPLSWRLAIAVVIAAIGFAAYALQDAIGVRGQAVAGVFFFFGLVAVFSANLRAVNWHTIVWGMALQIVLALLVLGKGQTYQITAILCFAGIVLALVFIHIMPVVRGEQVRIPGLIGGVITLGIAFWIFFRKGVHEGFDDLGGYVRSFIDFSDKGAEFVFGNLARPGDMAKVFGNDFIFCFAFKALPPILFVSAFFTVLYHFGVLQWCVRMLALVMVHLMRTSGAETLSVAANVFMGQTEAPLIVKPYVPRMTNSELFVLMASGMAHISGGMMVVYISYGANPVAVLTTCVMACPCSLYLSKLFLPEISRPETGGTVQTKKEKSPYVNAIDAAAVGTTDGLQLALNVGAMLIVFIAFVAMFDAILGAIAPTLVNWHFMAADQVPSWLNGLSLGKVFGWIFSPVAFLMGVAKEDVSRVGSLLGSKLSINEHFAYLQMRQMLPKTDPSTGVVTPGLISERSFLLTAFALTGFANFSSVGIQLGGIGAIAPNRRSDLARLGMRALFVGFTATLLNASIAGILLEKDVAAASAPAKNDTQSPKETAPANDSTPSNASPQTVPSNPAVPETQTDSSTKSAQAAAIWALPQRNRIEQAVIRNDSYFASSSFFARERYRHPTM